MEAFPLVNAAIFAKTSFFASVGEEQGLTDGVLLAEMVLLLKIDRSDGKSTCGLAAVPDIGVERSSWY